MTNLYRIFALLFMTVIFSVSCSDEQNTTKQTDSTEAEIIKQDLTLKADSLTSKITTDTLVKTEKKLKKNVKIYKYICPQGCTKGNSDESGTCPECGMELIENPDYITKKTK